MSKIEFTEKEASVLIKCIDILKLSGKKLDINCQAE